MQTNAETTIREEQNRRLLVVDDAQAIHEDFAKILPRKDGEREDLDNLLTDVFGDDAEGRPHAERNAPAEAELWFDVAHAYQGEEAVRMAERAAAEGTPFSVVFTDVRMPPGIDGVVTARRIWQRCPDTEIVICTAYSDHTWGDILRELGSTDQLQFLRKPLDVISVKQMALALSCKWTLARHVENQIGTLEDAVAQRTRELQEKVTELQQALNEISTLQGMIPMCMYCHKIRTGDEFWERVDEYISSHSPAEISHGICPECYAKHVEPQFANRNRSIRRPGRRPS